MEREKRILTAPKTYMTNEFLIAEVRKHPELWDESLADHHNRDLKKRRWGDVAKAFIGGSREFEVLLALF